MSDKFFCPEDHKSTYKKIRIFSYCEINIIHNVLVMNQGQVLRERSIQTLLLQSCTWRISSACSGRQCDRGDRVARNGERREKAEEREMIEELYLEGLIFGI